MAAGVGNVFKSEVLFVCGIDPFRTVASLSDDEARLLIEASRELLQANAIGSERPRAPEWGGGRRTTRRMDPSAKIIMCSALGQQRLIVQAIGLGARDFIVKPFRPERVVGAIKKALDVD